MRRSFPLSIAAALLLFGAAVAHPARAATPSMRVAAPGAQADDAAQPQADDDAQAKQTFTRMCNQCHTADRIVAERRTRTAWEDLLQKMQDKGAKGSDDDFAVVLDYLLRHYGRVNVNHAPAGDLAVILGLPPAQARAIVDYRTSHGDFADFEALEKVPDLDTARLEQERDAVYF